MSKTANITEFLNSIKVELSSEAVNLALMDDLKSQFKSVQTEGSKLLVIRDEFEKKAKQLKSFSDIVEEQSKRLIELANELEKKAKDLGIETPKEVEFFINQANDYIFTAKESRKKSLI